MPPQDNHTTCICGDANCSISYGGCHCGCGEPTKIATRTIAKRGIFKGVPFRFIHGHHARLERPDMSNAAPFKINGVYCRIIPLTQGQYTIVNANRYEYLSQYFWTAVWNKDTKSYYAIRHTRKGDQPLPKLIRIHRVVLGLARDDKRRGDHINGVTLDNRDKNLRPSPAIDNCANRKRNKNNTTGYKGTTFNKFKQKFIARIMRDRNMYHLGEFKTAIEAHDAYCRAAAEHYGEYARFK